METIGISEFINTDLKDWAEYSLAFRGVPHAFDCLTPVQRYIINASPTSTVPTNKVVGDAIKAGYDHGDSACADAAARLARSYGNSTKLLDGSGFFGNSISVASSSRYTKLKITKQTKECIDQYRAINSKSSNGSTEFFNVPYPIGLCTYIFGIAPGYNAKILPRKASEMIKFLNGDDSADLTPHFDGFLGKVESAGFNRWVISAKIDVDKRGNLRIQDLPHGIKYATFLQKLSEIISKYPRLKFENNSKKYVDIAIRIGKRSSSDIKELMLSLIKLTSITVTEGVLFITPAGVIKYNCVEDYLEDYKIHLKTMKLNWLEYEHGDLSARLRYSIELLSYLKFMHGNIRNRQEVSRFLKPLEFSDRLRTILAYRINKQEIKEIGSFIRLIKSEIKEKLREISSYKASVDWSIKFGFHGDTTEIG